MRRRYHLHLPGILYVALTVLVGIAAANRPNNLLVWVFGAMLSGVLISGLVSGGMLMRIRAQRLDPRRGAVGEPLVLRFAVANRSRIWPAFNLHLEELPSANPTRPTSAPAREGAATPARAIGWQDAMRRADGWVMHVGPGETMHGEVVLWPTRRGRVRFDRFRVWTTFPFGFLRKSVTFDQHSETLIHPRVYRLRPELLASLTRGGLGGFRLSSSAGPGEDYFGVREYRLGDSIRQIAWKRAAAREDLLTVERSRTSPPRLRVIVNLRTPTDFLRKGESVAASRDLEEEAIALAASILRLAEEEGYEVGLSVLGFPTPRAPLRRGHWHTEKLLATLAALDLDAPRDEHARLPETDRERAALVVVHPDRAQPGVAPPGAWHFTAAQLSGLIASTTPAPREPDEVAGSAAPSSTSNPRAALTSRKRA